MPQAPRLCQHHVPRSRIKDSDHSWLLLAWWGGGGSQMASVSYKLASGDRHHGT
jgi:hypothetical protein